MYTFYNRYYLTDFVKFRNFLNTHCDYRLFIMNNELDFRLNTSNKELYEQGVKQLPLGIKVDRVIVIEKIEPGQIGDLTNERKKLQSSIARRSRGITKAWNLFNKTLKELPDFNYHNIMKNTSAFWSLLSIKMSIKDMEKEQKEDKKNLKMVFTQLNKLG